MYGLWLWVLVLFVLFLVRASRQAKGAAATAADGTLVEGAPAAGAGTDGSAAAGAAAAPVERAETARALPIVAHDQPLPALAGYVVLPVGVGHTVTLPLGQASIDTLVARVEQLAGAREALAAEAVQAPAGHLTLSGPGWGLQAEFPAGASYVEYCAVRDGAPGTAAGRVDPGVLLWALTLWPDFDAVVGFLRSPWVGGYLV